MKNLIIVGGGISGLICAYIFNKLRDIKITIVEPGTWGGEFLQGGLKYIHRTERMLQLFEELDLAYSKYSIRGGLLLHNVVEKYPDCLRNMDKEDAIRIQRDHYRKTRCAEPGDFAGKSMNEPASNKPRTALRADFKYMIDNLLAFIRVSPNRLATSSLVNITKFKVWLKSGEKIPYDYLILTIPLWVIKSCAYWNIPESIAMVLNVIKLGCDSQKYAPWDYVYTPYTPAGAIHRFSCDGGDYMAEANGEWNETGCISDLNFIFGSGWWIKEIKTGLKGHLLPLAVQPAWPNRIVPIGRFAKWDSRSTVDVVLDDAIELKKRWFGQ